jgi:uncharacterized HhH-GPD family protein
VSPDSGGLSLAFDEDADALLDRDPFALLVGMLLDQQMPMERAFAGPARLATRLGDPSRLDPVRIAAADPDSFAALMAEPPAVHRFPAAMAGRVQALAAAVVADYEGDAGRIWSQARSGADLYARLSALPGYGDQKTRILIALLGKQRGVRPRGWRQACAPYGEPRARRSVADVVDRDSLLQVRAFKQEQKRAARS